MGTVRSAAGTTTAGNGCAMGAAAAIVSATSSAAITRRAIAVHRRGGVRVVEDTPPALGIPRATCAGTTVARAAASTMRAPGTLRDPCVARAVATVVRGPTIVRTIRGARFACSARACPMFSAPPTDGVRRPRCGARRKPLRRRRWRGARRGSVLRAYAAERVQKGGEPLGVARLQEHLAVAAETAHQALAAEEQALEA